MFMFFVLAACTGTEKITIAFETNGGKEIKELVIDAKSTDINLPEPVKEGFTSDGWFFDEALTSPF